MWLVIDLLVKATSAELNLIAVVCLANFAHANNTKSKTDKVEVSKKKAVLIDDVVDGLVRMGDAPEAVGTSFNLVGEPMMTARDYFDAINESLGARIRVTSGNLVAFYLSDAVKYGLKKYALRKRGVVRPSLADWKSRAHFTPFVNDKPKRLLGWQPESDRARFVHEAIGKANLMGF